MRKGWMRHLDFIVIDLLAVASSYVLAYLTSGEQLKIGMHLHGEMVFILVLIHLTLAFLTEAYENIVTRGYYKEFRAVIKQSLLVGGCFMIYYVYTNSRENISLWPMLKIGLWMIFLMYFFRIIWKVYLSHRYAKVKNSRQVLVVTTEDEIKKMISALCSEPIRNYEICGLAIVDKDIQGDFIEGLQIVANKENMFEFAEQNVVDEVLLNIPGDSEGEWKFANEFLVMGKTIHIYMQQQYEKLPNKYAGKIFGYDVLTSSISTITFRQILLKRLMDIIGGIIGLILAVLIGLVIAPVIYVKAPGKLLFSQIRVGKGGRKFRIYKFRSMYMDAEERKKDLMEQNEMKGHMFKIKDDPRIIKGIGHFIRKTSLDEFPQFWNVLKGDMSLVGTRPPTVDEYEAYEAHHKRRLSIKPGITGLWQISGRNDIMDFEEVVKLDVEYIEHYSLELDLKILIKTVLTIFKKDGAA